MPLNTSYVYEATVSGVAQGQAVVNVLHYFIQRDYAGVNPAPQSMAEMLAKFVDDWRAGIVVTLPAAYTALAYTIKEITGSRIKPGTSAVELTYGQGLSAAGGAAEDVGQLAGDILPTFNTATLQKLTGQLGRDKRGSIHLGPIREQDTNNNTLLAGIQGDLLDGMNGLDTLPLVNPAALNMVMCIFSKTNQLRGAQPNNNPAANATRIIGFFTNANIGSVLRRKKKRLLGE